MKVSLEQTFNSLFLQSHLLSFLIKKKHLAAASGMLFLSIEQITLMNFHICEPLG